MELKYMVPEVLTEKFILQKDVFWSYFLYPEHRS